MASRRTGTTRRSVTDAPVWLKPRRGTSKIDCVRLFRTANPIFTMEELVTHLGKEYETTVDQLVAKGELKKQATGIFSAVHIDQNDPEVKLLVTLTGATLTTPDRLAKQARRIVERMAVEEEAELRKKPAADNLLGWRAKVFSTREAWDRLGQDPRPTIAQLLARGLLDTIHSGVYCKRGVPRFGPEVLAWAETNAARRGEIVRSLDESEEHNSVRDGPGPFRVTGINFLHKDTSFKRDRVRITFQRLGWIQAVAGGPGNKYAAWQSFTKRTRLTKDAAAFVAEQVFGRNMLWGELIAVARAHQANPDKNPDTSDTLPRIRRHSYLDYAQRLRERSFTGRHKALRRGDIEEGPMQPEVPCILYVDHREDKRIADAVQGIANLSVVPAQLDTGDFIVEWGSGPEDRAVIERKTGADLESTILDRDLGSQVARLVQLDRQGTSCFLLQQGDPYDVPPIQVASGIRRAPPSVSSVKKTHSFAAMAAGRIRVIPVDTWQNAAKAILDIACYCSSPSLLDALLNPKTTGEEMDARTCSTQANTAAGRPDGPSSE